MQVTVGSPGSPSPTSCRIQLLGGLRVTLAGSDVAPAFPRKIGALLAYLACFLDRAHSRDLLIELFWPDADVEAGRASLRNALPLLRRLLEPPGDTPVSLLLADRQTVRLDPERVTSDVNEFERDLKAAARAASPGEQALLLERALSGYGGELLPGYYEPWVLTERERLSEAYIAALRQLAAARAQQGDLEGAIDAARRAVQADPLEEETHYELIQQFATAGQSAAARRHYQELERLLKAELDVTPSRSLEDILNASEPPRVSLAIPAPAASPAPERAPPAPRLPVPPLPVPMTPFFGREAEIAQVSALLEGRDTRLLTLTGLGGTGKTRLALEVARRLQEEGSDWTGVTFVPLVDLTDPDLLGQTLRGALNLPPAGDTDPLEQIATSLAGHRFLLVLDNFEQLLEAGPATVRQLLTRAPGLVCLVTSRRPLGLTAEAEYPVPPLPMPAPGALPERLLEFASVRLFLNRAQAARPDFQVTAANAEAVARLCQALEGIPLALELAAARSPVLTPAQMLQHLSDRFGFLVSRHRNISERHRTLRVALEWSYQSLPERHQRLLSRLSVFRGGWTLEAATAVCGDQTPIPLLDALLELRDASLVIAEEAEEAMRFRMLETVREYAGEQLARSGGQEGVQQRHATYFRELVEAARAHLGGADQAATVRRLEREHDNFRAALGWARAAGEDELRADLGCFLYPFWNLQGYAEEAYQLLAELGAEVEWLPLPCQARLLQALSTVVANRGDIEEAIRLLRRCLALYRELGETARTAKILADLGQNVRDRDPVLARGYFEEGLALGREAGDLHLVPWLMVLMSNSLYREGEQGRARELLTEARALCRAHGNLFILARVLVEEGAQALDSGDREHARACFEEDLALRRQIEDRVGIGFASYQLGAVAFMDGRFTDAAHDLENALAVFHSIQWDHSGVAVSSMLWLICSRRRLGIHDETETLARQSLRVHQDTRNSNSTGTCLFFLADAAARRGQPVRAARLLGILGTVGVRFDGPEDELIEGAAQLRASLIAELGEVRFAEEEHYGQALPPDKAMALALAE